MTVEEIKNNFPILYDRIVEEVKKQNSKLRDNIAECFWWEISTERNDFWLDIYIG